MRSPEPVTQGAPMVQQPQQGPLPSPQGSQYNQAPIQQPAPKQRYKPTDEVGRILDTEAEAIARYEQGPPSKSGSVLNAAVWDRIRKINPNYSEREYETINKTLTNFTSGPAATQLQSLNTVFPHMNHLTEIQLGLKTGNLQLVNKWANEFNVKTGSPPQAVFNAAKNAVADEISKSVVGPSAVADRKAFAMTLSSDLSPQQFAGVIRNYKDQILDRALSLKQQFKAGYGPAYSTARGEDKFDSFLKPEILTALTVKEAKAELARRQGAK